MMEATYLDQTVACGDRCDLYAEERRCLGPSEDHLPGSFDVVIDEHRLCLYHGSSGSAGWNAGRTVA